MEIYENLIEMNEMTRPGLKLENVQNIFAYNFTINESYANNYIKYFEDLKCQSDVYLSYHYIIDEFGNIVNIVPIEEVAYHSKDIDTNLNSIGIGIFNMISGYFEEAQMNSLKYLTNILFIKYNLKSEEVIDNLINNGND